MLQIGDMKVHIINDGDTLMDGGGPFGLVPRTLWSAHFMPPVRDNLVPMTLTCLLIQVDGKNIVADTGYGTKEDDKLRKMVYLERPVGGLADGLARLGVMPEDVDIVINTHLHYDHAGGNTKLDPDTGEAVPVFPNAKHLVQRREYEDAMRPNERTRATYLFENYQPLIENGQMQLLDGDYEVLPGVRCVVTPGHTPGHMSVILERGDDHAIFVCDMASLAIHFERLGWMTAYDVEPLITLETKRQWQQWVLDNDALVIFPHDPERPVCKMEKRDGKPRLVPVDENYA